jgi:UDP-hydrolysing UDP-N-acetyl-D-glucosamine 2-epimerase
MKNYRKICVVVTARPSYSRIKTVLLELTKIKNIKLQIVVASSALLEKYGTVVDLIKSDGFNIDAQLYNVLEGENLITSAITTGLGIIEIANTFNSLKPDIVVTIADRYETIATAIAASYMNIPLAHVQGGEVTGNIDEKVRHSVTKLADYHFVSSQDAYNRVLKMGECKKNIYLTGCPSIDIANSVLKSNLDNFNPFLSYKGVGAGVDKFISHKFLVLLQHPVTNEYKDSHLQISESLLAIKKLNIPTIIFWPNIDAGSDLSSKVIRKFREDNMTSPFFYFKNLNGTDFLQLLKNALCLIGNSSVGIRECSWLGVPVVNIGSRQNRRLRGKNVIDVDYCHKKIISAINLQIKKGRYKSESIYGDGKSGKRIAKLLSEVPLINHKTITY